MLPLSTVHVSQSWPTIMPTVISDLHQLFITLSVRIVCVCVRAKMSMFKWTASLSEIAVSCASVLPRFDKAIMEFYILNFYWDAGTPSNTDMGLLNRKCCSSSCIPRSISVKNALYLSLAHTQYQEKKRGRRANFHDHTGFSPSQKDQEYKRSNCLFLNMGMTEKF